MAANAASQLGHLPLLPFFFSASAVCPITRGTNVFIPSPTYCFISAGEKLSPFHLVIEKLSNRRNSAGITSATDEHPNASSLEIGLHQLPKLRGVVRVSQEACQFLIGIRASVWQRFSKVALIFSIGQ